MKKSKEEILAGAKRVVVKVGSTLLATCSGEGRGSVFQRIATDIHGMKGEGKEVVLVTSGAVALGMKELGIIERPTHLGRIQALAALGQGILLDRYRESFFLCDERIAQILLTADDMGDRRRFLNARNTIETLLEMGIVPVINENDTVAVDEIKYGDNDNLAALTANLVDADLLLMFTDIDGLYDKNPTKFDDAVHIGEVEGAEEFDEHIIGLGESSPYSGEGSGGLGGEGSGHHNAAGLFGSGGMESKVKAAKKAAHFGIHTFVTTIGDAEAGDISHGTLFRPLDKTLTSHKHWIAYSAKQSGAIVLDEGAVNAVVNRGSSLLPSGVVEVQGTFDAGDVLHCMDRAGKEVGRGITNYSSNDLDKIKGKRSSEIVSILALSSGDEVIHRNDLVLL